MNYVFVYGSLRRGMHNHYLLGDSEFVGNGKTVAKYGMVDVGSFPAVVEPEEGEAGETEITGEVYRVDAKTLERLDRLEGYPKFYDREPTAIVTADDMLTAWMYYWPTGCSTNGTTPVPSGDWVEYHAPEPEIRYERFTDVDCDFEHDDRWLNMAVNA